MSMPKRQRLFLIVAGVAVGLLVLDRLVIGPLADHWKLRAAEIATLQRSIAAGRGVSPSHLERVADANLRRLIGK